MLSKGPPPSFRKGRARSSWRHSESAWRQSRALLCEPVCLWAFSWLLWMPWGRDAGVGGAPVRSDMVRSALVSSTLARRALVRSALVRSILIRSTLVRTLLEALSVAPLSFAAFSYAASSFAAIWFSMLSFAAPSFATFSSQDKDGARPSAAPYPQRSCVWFSFSINS